MTSIGARRVIVGVDETAGSRAALAFAMREAGLRGSVLDVITVWTLTDDDRDDPSATESGTGLPEGARQRAQQIQDRAVAQTLQDFDPRPLLSRQVVEGHAGEVLLRLSREADFLVVGSSASECLRPQTLGAVSDYCVRRASCAVVVVRCPASLTHTRVVERAS